MATRQIAETQMADPHSDKPLHFVANLVKHPSNLAINSLAKEDAQSGRFDGMHGLDPRALPVEDHAVM